MKFCQEMECETWEVGGASYRMNVTDLRKVSQKIFSNNEIAFNNFHLHKYNGLIQ